jgi:ATP-binding protein involved in chromosome partitioning
VSETLQERIASALRTVQHPRLGTDVVGAEVVRDIATTTDGRVRLTLLVSAADDPALVRDVRRAVERVTGVADVRVDVKDPAEARNPSQRPGKTAPRRALPMMDTAAPAQARVPAPTPVAYPGLGRIIAVSSGKGGVGKSTVAVNLAVALAQEGKRIGIMDADIYGPNLPRMLGVGAPPPVSGEKILPLEAHGVKVMSLGFLIEREQPAIWRGPIVMKIIGQFLRDVEWGQLDYLFVDMPPGTGDAQLSLVQSTKVHGAIIVTTPQQVAVGDALRGAKMFERVSVPVFGIVENMSWFECPHCGKPSAIFGTGGGEALAKELNLPLLGQIPYAPRVMEGGDAGTPIMAADAESSAGRALRAVATKVTELAARIPV